MLLSKITAKQYARFKLFWVTTYQLLKYLMSHNNIKEVSIWQSETSVLLVINEHLNSVLCEYINSTHHLL